MAEVDPNSIPFVPPSSVTLIDTSEDALTAKPGGKPTTAFHDWMSAIFDWMKRSVVDLTTKITTLTDDQEDLSAALTVEQTARVNGDTALAAAITTVDAKANNATANGQIFLAAKANPSGATAAYGVYLTAGSTFTGLQMIAKSGGGSAIGLTAGQLTFTDSGTAQQVFNYSSGIFYFNVPVAFTSTSGSAYGVINANGAFFYDPSSNSSIELGFF